MSVTVEWHDLALRLALTVAAGLVIGFNRSERGHAAGLRTTLLVCLAASVAMIQTNLLLAVGGKTPASFSVMDVMRLPLGILTGMGFIGGGAILRRGEMVRGVTTAATLWMVTVIGLCFGGGQIALGLAALALTVITLWWLKRLEVWMPQDHRATLYLCIAEDGPGEEDVRQRLLAEAFTIASWSVACKARDGCRCLTFRAEVKWSAGAGDMRTPDVVHQLARHPGVLELRWKA